MSNSTVTRVNNAVGEREITNMWKKEYSFLFNCLSSTQNSKESDNSLPPEPAPCTDVRVGPKQGCRL